MQQKCFVILWTNITLLAVLSFFGTQSIAMASGGQAHELNAEQINELQERIESSKERLKLTPEQEGKVVPLLQENGRKKIEVLKFYGFGQGKDKHSLSFREKRELAGKMRDIQGDTDRKLQGTLNEQQMREYQAMQEENRDKLREKIKE